MFFFSGRICLENVYCGTIGIAVIVGSDCKKLAELLICLLIGICGLERQPTQSSLSRFL